MAEYRVRMVKLREKELDLCFNQLLGCATTFALLAGIMADAMWTGYYMYAIQLGERDGKCPCSWIEAWAASTMYISIFLPMLGLFHAMLVTLLAPRKALHGDPEHLGEVVEAFQEEVVHSVRLLMVSVASIFGTGASWAWSTPYFAPMPIVASIAVTALCACCLYGVYVVLLRTRTSFRVRNGMITSSSFFSVGQLPATRRERRPDGSDGDRGAGDRGGNCSGGGKDLRCRDYCRLHDDEPSPTAPADADEVEQHRANSLGMLAAAAAAAAAAAGPGTLIGLSAQEERELRSCIAACTAAEPTSGPTSSSEAEGDSRSCCGTRQTVESSTLEDAEMYQPPSADDPAEHALVEHALVEHAPVAVLVPERDKVKGLSVEDFMQGAVMDLDDWTCSTFRGL